MDRTDVVTMETTSHHTETTVTLKGASFTSLHCDEAVEKPPAKPYPELNRSQRRAIPRARRADFLAKMYAGYDALHTVEIPNTENPNKRRNQAKAKRRKQRGK